MKLLKTTVVLTLVVGLLLGGALPALADSVVTSTQSTPSPQLDRGPWAWDKVKVIRGVVDTVTDDGITLESDEEIFVDDGTRYRVPTMGKSDGLEDIKPGMRIVALVYERDGELHARHIVVIPGRPQYRHHVGKVTAYEVGVSITIEDKWGNIVPFEIGDEFKILPQGATVDTGDWVTVISRRDPVNDRLIARGVVVHSPRFLTARLNKILEGIERRGLERLSGTITGVNDTTIIIDTKELQWDSETTFILRGILVLEGQSVTVFYREGEDDILPLARIVLVGIELPE